MNDNVIDLATKAMVRKVTKGEERMPEQAPWEEEPAIDDREFKDREPTPAKMEDPETIKQFLLAGHARVTLVSTATGDRYTYQITSTPPNADGRESPVSHFVAVLTGPDNTDGRSYSYVGHIFRFTDYTHAKPEKAKVPSTATSAKAWFWFWNAVVRGSKRPADLKLEVWHEGRCGACGRVLTVPESIARGLGPECYGRSS